MSEGLLFGIGAVIFVLVSWAILLFGYARFNAFYVRDQNRGDDVLTPDLAATPGTLPSSQPT